MEKPAPQRLKREDWVRAALNVLQDRGMESIKIVKLAQDLNATSGSFYWHFKNLRELLDSVLAYWEITLTDAIVEQAKNFSGSAQERILWLMVSVIEQDAASPDHAISVWARTDPAARAVYERTIQKRFEFAAWMFSEVGFAGEDARLRGRMMVAYLMGESSTHLKAQKNWRQLLRKELEILTAAGKRDGK